MYFLFRSGLAGAAIDNCIYVAGGWNDKGLLDTAERWVFDKKIKMIIKIIKNKKINKIKN